MFHPFFLYAGIALFCVYIPLHVWGSRKMNARPTWDGCRGFSMIPSNIVGILMVDGHWALLPAVLIVVALFLALAAFTDVLG